jgi:hypothetical protein
VSKNLETPADEMARLIRVIAGKASAGEKDQQLRARAARRLGITTSRARVFWYGETDNIRSDEMDLARELAFVQPIQEAEDAITTAEAFLAGLRARLEGSLGTPARRVGAGHPLRRAGDRPQREVGGRPVASRLDQALTIARHQS